jgi:purine-binding chemotaxis protein CheW
MTEPGHGTGQPIDWRAVHARLEQAAAATRAALCPSAEQAKAVMDERARALAASRPGPPAPPR